MFCADYICVTPYSMLSSTWVTWSYLSCQWLHPATSPTGKVCMWVWVCVRCTTVSAVTVIAHQSEAAEHTHWHSRLPACLSGKNRYVKRQALPPVFPRIVCLSWWGEKRKERSLVCISSDEKSSQHVWRRMTYHRLGKWHKGEKGERRKGSCP